ncbi:MAG: DnaD domain protein [Lachnospiraceae bacterium]|nr:DnaD domain protein [Lachnospiraceae bacterium]
MKRISINSKQSNDTTLVSNIFIDRYMPSANGAYVKIYLYLLRCLTSSSAYDISLSDIADSLGNTEADIVRALNYWEANNLLTIQRNGSNDISGITFNPLENAANNVQGEFSSSSDIKAATEHIQDEISVVVPDVSIKDDEELVFIITVAEKYMQRMLTANDEQLIIYLYTKAGFSSEMILELYDHCSTAGKTDYRYIEKVASSWIKSNVKTVDDIKNINDTYNDTYKAVAKAFGIVRTLGTAEKNCIDKWSKTYGFSTDIITEACGRALFQTQKPDFNYTDRILTAWSKKGVHTFEDIKKLDDEHKKQSLPANVQPFRQASSNAPKKPVNKFNSFSQRNYSTQYFDELEKRLLN